VGPFFRQPVAVGAAGMPDLHSAMKDPQTGKNCVRFIAAEPTNVGQTRMIYRNTCGSAKWVYE
jgi:hypothetical protein